MSLTILGSLNAAQTKAVQHPPNKPLQILAGPGSGKTKVLTSRIAYLILEHSIPASSICAVTFTNKAANEMKERLKKMIGEDQTNMLKMGTFHAFCVPFLRKHAKSISIQSNFTICDAAESQKIITKLLKSHADYIQEHNIALSDGQAQSAISKAKSKGQSPEDMAKSHAEDKAKLGRASPYLTVLMEIFRDYERILRKNNSLDFDDLLVFGTKLFKQHPDVVSWCRHVLVDEFQDTNSIQYELMKRIASFHHCVTVVGDPDQSIYGWRSADITNLQNMERDFPATSQILLEDNYRSTASILAVSLAIISKDKSRISKSLRTSHPAGISPVLQSFGSDCNEAIFMATEIKRLVAASGGMFKWSDFAILLRFNALSRVIESALQKEGIPNRVLGGHKFFERMEVKDLLAYLQVVDNSLFVPAFMRVINVPPRGIGKKSVAEIVGRAEKAKCSPLEIVEQIHDSKIPDIKPPVKRKIVSFVRTIRSLRKYDNERESPPDLIRRLLDLTEYEQYLQKTEDWASRWENVQELINFASQTHESLSTNIDFDQLLPQSHDTDDDSRDELEHEGFVMVNKSAKAKGKEKAPDLPIETPLRAFLQASMLSTDTEETDDDSNEKVTISTCHSAKGLEWPVVMVPGVESHIFPFYRSEDAEEERRLLYVACTRAQSLLYLQHTTGRGVAGDNQPRELSPFISAVTADNWNLFSSRPPKLSVTDLDAIATVLGRPCPDQSEVRKRMLEWERTGAQTRQAEAKLDFNIARPWPRTEPPASAAFTTSRSILVPANSTLTNQNPSTESKPPSTKMKPPSTKSKPSSTKSEPSIINVGPPRRGSASALAKEYVPTNSSDRTASRSWPTKPTSANDGFLPSFPKPLPSVSSAPELPVGSTTGLVNGSKRRLGMGRPVIEYPNKKFKTPV